jgi:hypothetical protein
MFADEPGCPLAMTTLLCSLLGLNGVTQTIAETVCKPVLKVTEVQFSQMQPPAMQRRWTAVVSVDASRCAADSAGYFEIGFSRLKENAPDIDFVEQFSWRAPAVKVDVEFWADEAVVHYWISNVSVCPCSR